MFAITSVPNMGKIMTPVEHNVSVATPDSMTKAQKATIANAINDWPSMMTGFAWTAKGDSKAKRIKSRAQIVVFAGTKVSTEVRALRHARKRRLRTSFVPLLDYFSRSSQVLGGHLYGDV